MNNLPDTPVKRGISVVMPALNEERNIEAAVRDTLRAFDDLGLDGEIIVVNDGSSDGTEQVAAGIRDADPRVRILRHEQRQGVGASFWDGVDQATKEAVIMLPGDNENDPWECLRYHDLLNHVDIIVPFVFNRAARSRFRNAVSYLYQSIVNLTFGSFFNYTNGTVLYRRSVLQQVAHRSRGFFFQTDILVRTTRQMGYLFAEVPYRLRIRREGRSKAITWSSFLAVARDYLKLVADHYFGKKARGGVYCAPDSATRRRRGECEPKS